MPGRLTETHDATKEVHTAIVHVRPSLFCVGCRRGTYTRAQTAPSPNLGTAITSIGECGLGETPFPPFPSRARTPITPT